jgi:hypothetical protein
MVWTDDILATRVGESGSESLPRRAFIDFHGFSVVDDPATGRKRISPENIKGTVNAATTAALPANTRTNNTLQANANGALGAQDTIPAFVGMRLVVKNEASQLKNGVYKVTQVGNASAPWIMTREPDADESADFVTGSNWRVAAGALNGGKRFALSVAGAFVLNTDAVTFVEYDAETVKPATERGQQLEAVETSPGSGIFFWAQRRGWIRPDIDLTGSVDATAAINAAANVRDGACVELPHGVVRIDGAIAPGKAGVTITGSEGRGLRRGHRVDVPVPNAGTLIHARGTASPLFASADECSFRNLEIYYPDQNPNGVTPTTYQPTFNITHFGCTVENVTAINPYTFLQVAVGGFTADRLIGCPLFRGIILGICPDVVRISNVHFNQNVSASNPTYRAIGPNLITYIAANVIQFLIDGAEGFQFSNCFSYNGVRGLHLGGGSGYFHGGGFDQAGTCVMLAGAGGVGASTLAGIHFVSTGFIPKTGGVGVHFADTHTAASASERPRVEITGGLFDATAPGAGRGVVFPAASYGVCQINGGLFQHMDNECGLNDSDNAYLQARGVASTPTCAARFQGTSANIEDIDPFEIP